MLGIGRREFITLLVAAAWPLAARAQQPAMPVVGYLGPASPETSRNQLAAFHRGLADTGYVEGRNVAIEYRWAENHYDRLPALATELVHRQLSVIVAGGTTPGAQRSRRRPKRSRSFFWLVPTGSRVASSQASTVRAPISRA